MTRKALSKIQLVSNCVGSIKIRTPDIALYAGKNNKELKTSAGALLSVVSEIA